MRGLIAQLQREHGLSYIFISHDLAVVRAMSHQVLVMKDGQVVERGPTDAIFRTPQHAYTQALLTAALGARSPVIPVPATRHSREGGNPEAR